jgi:hypothetical protein
MLRPHAAKLRHAKGPKGAIMSHGVDNKGATEVFCPRVQSQSHKVDTLVRLSHVSVKIVRLRLGGGKHGLDNRIFVIYIPCRLFPIFLFYIYLFWRFLG